MNLNKSLHVREDNTSQAQLLMKTRGVTPQAQIYRLAQ